MSDDVRPIRTDADLHTVLKEIDSLFDAQPGTAEFDRLEVLTILAVDYESKYHPIEAPTPHRSHHVPAQEPGEAM